MGVGCLVADDKFDGMSMTHAEMVAQSAASLVAGEEEGVVLVFKSDSSSCHASVRKWKNSSEGQGVSQRHALELRRCQQLCNERTSLDKRVGSMLATLACVAEAETRPKKVGRAQK